MTDDALTFTGPRTYSRIILTWGTDWSLCNWFIEIPPKDNEYGLPWQIGAGPLGLWLFRAKP